MTSSTSKNHTLVITSLVNGGYLYLDRIDIVQDASKPADSNGSATAFPVPPDETGGHTSTSNIRSQIIQMSLWEEFWGALGLY